MHATGEGLFEEIKRLRRERDEARARVAELERALADAMETHRAAYHRERAALLPPEGQ